MRKPLSGPIFSILLLLSVAILNNGCTKTPVDNTIAILPDVVTYGIMSTVTQTTAISGGVATYNAYGNITANGVCWSSTNQLPTIADSKTTDTVVAVNVGFTSRITGLTNNTTYYLRAYVTNAAGTGYGAVVKFTTTSTVGVLTGTVSTIAGSSNYGFADGAGASALFNGPQFISFNPVAGNVYISDTFNNLIRTMTTSGTVSSLTKPTLGLVNGTLATALFYGPSTAAFDAQGNAYVADLGNNVIRKITPAGVVTTFAGNGINGYADGAGTVAEFSAPQGLAIDAQGNVYVADRGNNLIRMITSAGVVSTIAGGIANPGIAQANAPGYVDGTAGPYSVFNKPSSIALDGQGNLYVADVGNRAIRIVTLSTGATTTLAGNNVQKNLLGSPVALTIDAQGNLFVADQSGRILEITTGRILYILAGSSNTVGFTNGVGAAATFNTPQGVAVDAQGVVYVADFGNNSIRKITVKAQ